MLETPTAETPPLPAGTRLRWLELALVLAVAFSGSVLYSISLLFEPAPASSSPGMPAGTAAWQIVPRILSDVVAVALLAYVLFRQGRRLRDLGLRFRWTALPVSVGLLIAAQLCYWAWSWALYEGWRALTGHWPEGRHHHVEFLGGDGTVLGFICLLLYAAANPIKEELLVRAYLLSEVRFLTGRTWLAVLASVGLQVCYHFYQGVCPALSYLGLFLVFALYYAKTRQIVPVILAHLYMDLGSVLRHHV